MINQSIVFNILASSSDTSTEPPTILGIIFLLSFFVFIVGLSILLRFLIYRKKYFYDYNGYKIMVHKKIFSIELWLNQQKVATKSCSGHFWLGIMAGERILVYQHGDMQFVVNSRVGYLRLHTILTCNNFLINPIDVK
ncbi:MAG: hypothetical protein FWF56_06155 [Firmicutes bacterium]|nr:hypothetical protein [Bacillota bacterium]MCL1953288.1 hypothetical protein [Bacillota bacterium]